MHLDKEAVSKLTENLNLALNAMQESLDNISAEYMNEVNEEQIEDEE